jgi:hypothetical protein
VSLMDDIARINGYIDTANKGMPEDDAMRVMKIGEEYGEAVAAYIGMTGQNPRKGVTHTRADLCSELADVAITALCAIAHFNGGNPVLTGEILNEKIQSVLGRIPG